MGAIDVSGAIEAEDSVPTVPVYPAQSLVRDPDQSMWPGQGRCGVCGVATALRCPIEHDAAFASVDEGFSVIPMESKGDWLLSPLGCLLRKPLKVRLRLSRSKYNTGIKPYNATNSASPARPWPVPRARLDNERFCVTEVEETEVKEVTNPPSPKAYATTVMAADISSRALYVDDGEASRARMTAGNRSATERDANVACVIGTCSIDNGDEDVEGEVVAVGEELGELVTYAHWVMYCTLTPAPLASAPDCS